MRSRKTLLAVVMAFGTLAIFNVSTVAGAETPVLPTLSEVAAPAGGTATAGTVPVAHLSARTGTRRAAAALFAKINRVRARHGLRRLKRSPSLRRSAARYARWMLRHDYFGHLGRARISRRFAGSGEIIARHSGRRPRASKTLRMWMRSPGHRALVLSRRMRMGGAGAAVGRYGGRANTFWVVHFGRR